MQTKSQISITRKTLYLIMLLAIFLSAFGPGNSPIVSAQEISVMTSKVINYIDSRYGYTIEVPMEWYLYPSDPSASISLTTICNYQVQDNSGQDVGRPVDGVCMQIGVGELKSSQTFKQWVEEREMSETDPAYVGEIGIVSSSISEVLLGGIEGVAFILNRNLDNSGVLEINIPIQQYVISIGINGYDSTKLSDALLILSTLSLNVTDINLNIPISLYDPGIQGLSATQWIHKPYSLPAEIDSLITILESTIPDVTAQATSCSTSGSFDWSEAPTSPIELYMPFRDGETWRVGGDGSFYGNWAHGNCFNDYYATDWNRDNDFQADVLPVADGEITSYVSPCASTGLGCQVTITHSSGIRTVYGHLDSVVKTSGSVYHWDVIGKVGQSGTNSPHLHLSFRKFDTSGYYSRCNSGVNNGKCPNGENPEWPQSPRPSPINTQNGSQALVDGNSYTSNNKDNGNPQSNCQVYNFDGIVLWDQDNCNGEGLSVNDSSSVINLPDYSWNDRAESIYVHDGWSLRVWQDSNSGAATSCIYGSKWDLNQDKYDTDSNRSMHRDISSIQVFHNPNCTGASNPDLVIQSITASPSSPSLNQPVTFTVRIKNQGAGNANSSFYVDLFADAQPGSCPTDGNITYWIVASLAAGATQDLTYTYSGFSNSGTHNLYAIADSYCSVSESNDGNNTIGPTVISVQQPQAPSVPTISGPGNGQYFNEGESINLSWSAVGSEYYGEVWGGPGGTLTFGWQSGTSNNIGSQWAGYTYSWRVKARNSTGESGWSETRTFIVRPGAPTNLGASVVSCSQINLSWSDNSGNEEGYKVYRNGNLITTLGSGVTSYQNTGLAGSTNYSYTVKAYRGSIESNASNTASATTQSCPAGPTTPTIISPVQNTVLVYPQNVAFDWSDSGDTYTFYFPGGPSATQYNTTASATTVNAPLAGFYEWFVVAHRNGQDSSPSAFIDLYIVPSAPQSVNTTTNSSSAVTINWTTSLGGVDEYKIYRNNVYVATVNANTYSFQVTNLPCGNTSTYSVRAYKGSGAHNESPERSASGSTSSCPNGSGDTYEPDNDSSTAKWIYSGSPQMHSIVPSTDVDWVKFTLSSQSAVLLETNGATSSDTRMWLYNSSLVEVESSDDEGIGLYSVIDRVCGADPLAAGTYYVKVDEYGNNNEIPAYNLSFSAKTCPSASVNVFITGERKGSYLLGSGEEQREYYNVSGGPVTVQSLSGMPIVSAIRLQSFTNDTLYSFVETMGVPSGLLSHKYYFPTYNNTWGPLSSQVRFGNLDANPTTIRVTIGGENVWEQVVPGLEERRLTFPVSGGPVIIESLDTSKKIVAAIRLQSYANDTLYSFSETTGIPNEYVSHKYYFPTYNNTWAPLNSQVRFGNLDATTTRIRVTIGGVNVWEQDVPGLEERRLNFAVSGGPVIVESLNTSKKIVAAIRLQSYANNTLYSFLETMGVPDGLLSHKYYFPTYNNTWAPLNSQVRFANLNATTTRIRVTIGGVNVWEQDVPGLEERRLNFAVSGGPVIIESLDTSKKIVAAIRLQSYANNILYSFSETMGIPSAFLTDVYYFPTYNNTWAPLNSQLRFGVP